MKPGLDTTEKTLAALTTLTGLIHIAAGITNSFPLLTWAGLGFIGGTALFLTAPRIDRKLGLEQDFTRTALTGLMLPYTGFQFIAYYSIIGLNFPTVAVIDKLIQASLLAVGTTYLWRKTSGAGI